MKVKEFIGKAVYYDEDGQMIFSKQDNQLLSNIDISVRGWGAIQQLFKTEEEAANFQDELGEWIADAINQKLKS